LAKRYDQMLVLITQVKPRTIVEVGVHRALRASKLCREALKCSPEVHYIGYDVFDTMGEEFQAQALNGKGTPTEREARKVLDAMPTGFTYELVIGDTRETLHGRHVAADFAFIDGDHRVEAIRSDYRSVDADCIVFDDFYSAGHDGRVPDLSEYGANAVVDELIAAGARVDILPVADLCNHGGMTRLAVVWR